jgi:hypothetical protein
LCGGPLFLSTDGGRSTGLVVLWTGRGRATDLVVLRSGGKSKSVQNIVLPSCSSSTSITVAIDFPRFIVMVTVQIAATGKGCARVDDKV